MQLKNRQKVAQKKKSKVELVKKVVKKVWLLKKSRQKKFGQ